MTADEGRYARHALIDWWDQQRLADARILVAGAGAIGNEVLKLLALMGVGQNLIVDFDRIEVSNLARTVLFREEDAGRGKAEVAAERVRALNPDCRAGWIAGDLEYAVGLGVYRAMDVVLGCLDSIDARLALNRACYRMGVPWIDGGIEATLAEVALYRAGRGACFECAMSEALWAQRRRRFSCTGLRNVVVESRFPTTAAVASIAAGYMVNEALLLLHGPEGRKEGLGYSQKLYLQLKPYAFHIADLPVNDRCLAHEIWAPVEVLAHSPHDLTAAGLLRRAGMPDGAVELGFDLLAEMRCSGCGQAETILRPLETCSVSLGRCPACGEDARLPETLSWLDAASDHAQRPLSDLCVPEYPVLALKGERERRYVQLTGEYRFR